jgi:hypothetical protein
MPIVSRVLIAPAPEKPVNAPQPNRKASSSEGPPAAPRQIQIDRRRLRTVLLILDATFVVISFSLAAIRITTGHNVIYGLFRLLDLNHEANIPTWYSTILLLACACVAGLVGAAARGSHGRGWKGIALVMAFFSLDETAGFHERFVLPPDFMGPFGPVRNITWVFVGAVVTGALVALFLRTVWELPPRIRRAVLVAGAIYAGGALGMETLGGLWALGHGEVNWMHAVLEMLEEGGELLGATLFLDAGLKYLETLGGISVRAG